MDVLLQSRKFWLMAFDVLISLLTYFITKYVSPAAAQDILYVIGLLQPVVIAVIVAITVQNLEGQRSDTNLELAKLNKSYTPPFIDD